MQPSPAAHTFANVCTFVWKPVGKANPREWAVKGDVAIQIRRRQEAEEESHLATWAKCSPKSQKGPSSPSNRVQADLAACVQVQGHPDVLQRVADGRIRPTRSTRLSAPSPPLRNAGRSGSRTVIAMARQHLALLAALAALLAAAPTALAVEKPPFTVEDLGTGAPKEANCSVTESGPLGGNWVEMTQVGAPAAAAAAACTCAVRHERQRAGCCC